MSSMLKIVDGNQVFIGTLLVPDGVKQGLRQRGYYQMAFYAPLEVSYAADYVPNVNSHALRVLFRDACDSNGRVCATVEGMTIAELEREDGFAFIPKSAAGGR